MSPPSSQRWTDSQRRAIEHPGGDLLISAAAGSGKTAVLAQRCARLVCDAPPPNTPRTGIDNLLVLTFTEAAATEMRSRIASAIRDRLRQPANTSNENLAWLRRQAAMVDRASISTLHAFCVRILRQHFHEAGNGDGGVAGGGGIDPAFQIMDEEESRLVQDDVLDELLARWHKLPSASTAPSASQTQNPISADAFTDFFEAYAQGRDALCRDLILSVHRMLSTTADPAAYLAKARQSYANGKDGAAALLESYARTTLANRLRVAGITAQRACDQVASFLGSGPMLNHLQVARQSLQQAHDLLTHEGIASWVRVQTLIDLPWPRLTSVKVEGFQALKDRTWQPVKDAFNDLAKFFQSDPAVMLQDLLYLAQPLDTLLTLTTEFQTAFTTAKRADNRLDFADLERLALTLLTPPPSPAPPLNLASAELRQRYHHVLVDEFQDINPLQAELLHAVRNPTRFDFRGNLFVVGDVKQSIYAFRLAQPELFLQREHLARQADTQHPAAPPSHIALQHNFRSQPKLLAVMNGIFQQILTPDLVGIDYADHHALMPPPSPPSPPMTSTDPTTFTGTPVELCLLTQDTNNDDHANDPEDPGVADNDPAENLSAVEQEARLVAQRITDLMKQNRTIRQKDGTLRPLKYRDIALLLRTVKAKAMVFARALAARGIPVHADLSTGFFDTQEVKDALALLQVLDNPQQDIPLATVLLGPFGRFSHDDFGLIRLTFDRKEVPFSGAVARYSAGAPAPDLLSTAPPFSADLAARLDAFFARLALWREKLRSRPLHEGLAEIFAESRIMPYLAGLDTGQQRIANLQMLHQRALKFSTFKKQGLHRFLRFIQRLRERESSGWGGGSGGDIGEAPVLSEASDVVRILSIHKSKGLEFPIVILSGLGSKLRLTSPGPVLIHRDLGIGLSIADIDRNIWYPSAAARRITEELRRSLRAEELRLLYVAITRARDCLILTGHLGKRSALDDCHQAWSGHEGPLPEDILLKGQTPLDWLLPALITSGLNVSWDGTSGAAVGGQDHEPQVVVTLHTPEPAQAASPASASEKHSQMLSKILAAEPLDSTPPDAAVQRLITRVTGRYPYEDLTRRPAVQTVSFLKSQQDGRADAGEVAALPIDDLAAAARQTDLAEWGGELDALVQETSADPTHSTDLQSRIQAAKLRGTATHRILELLDFAHCSSPSALTSQIDSLISKNLLSQDFAHRADLPGIQWFLWHSQSGQRLITAAQKIAAGDTSLKICRELPFAWIAPPDPPHSPLSTQLPQFSTPHSALPTPNSPDPADLPTIRGIIDLLLLNPSARTAEILDYKTDSIKSWQSHLEDYRRQMSYYLHAASDILNFPVHSATLIFLSPRQEITVQI